jgi:hypothetical protein
MGLIDKVIGGSAATEALGRAATSVAEVFTPNATAQMENSHTAYLAALSEHGAEFATVRQGFFDTLVNGLNRLPRPFLALGTMGLFVYAMVDPISFSQRMVGLGYIPEPLWWLLGAIVSFYFGAREAHYFRTSPAASFPSAAPAPTRMAGPERIDGPQENEALMDWMARRGG